MKVIILGDSYTYGQGCTDRYLNFDPVKHGPSEHCWASLIQQYYPTLTVANYGFPGIDNLNSAKLLHQNLTQDVDLVIFCATFISRMPTRSPHMISENHTTITISPHWKINVEEPGFDTAVESYFKHLYSDLLGSDILANSLMSAYGAAKFVNADFWWSMPTKGQPRLKNSVFDRLDNCRFESTPDFSYTASELAPCRHPNNNGHDRYFKQIIMPMLYTYLNANVAHILKGS